MLPRFDLGAFCKAIEQHKVTVAHIVPPIFILLAKDPSVRKYDLSSIRFFWSGAAPLSKELSDEVANLLNVGVIQGYGMTESSPVSHVPRLGNVVNGECLGTIKSKDTVQSLTLGFAGSIGELIPGMKARIVDENGNGE